MNELSRQDAGNLTDQTSKIISRALFSAGPRRLILCIARDILGQWSLGSRIRQKIAKPFNGLISRSLKNESPQNNATLSCDLGDLLTNYARNINAAHQKNPVCHAEERTGSITDLIGHTDFGELKELVEGSEACLLKTLESINNAIWPYPAKIGCLVGILLSIGNTSIKGLSEIIRPLLQNLGPDLTADILLSILRELSGEETAKLTNSISELIRRLHTGSALLAKGDKSLFEFYLLDFLNDFLAAIDPEILTKSRIALAEDKETIASSLANVLSQNPQTLLFSMKSYAALKNPGIRSVSHKIAFYDDLDDEFAEAANSGISDIDTQKMADITNSLLSIINRMHTVRPELFGGLLKDFADSIDTSALKDTCEWLIPEVSDALTPVVTELLPPLILGLCELIGSTDIDHTDEMEEALQALRSMLAANWSES
ncbi:MAG: hypothetical protein JW920_07630 [Deltaproteobacteria bacterium]|nr:hypothetical protein [Deltaproteobacteria bacterium]